MKTINCDLIYSKIIPAKLNQENSEILTASEILSLLEIDNFDLAYFGRILNKNGFKVLKNQTRNNIRLTSCYSLIKK